MNTETHSIPLDRIDLGQRLRAVDPAYTQLLAASMEERGQITPIDVRVGDRPGRFHLIAGAHRYFAGKSLGWTEIEARIREVDDLEAELIEIDENLMRHELSELDRATFLARRKELHEELHPHTRHGAKRPKGKVDKIVHFEARFTQEVAERLNLSERSIRRAIARANRIGPDVRARIAGTWLADHGAQLDALAKLEPGLQRRVAAVMIGSDGPRTVALAIANVRGERPTVPDVDDEQLRRLSEAWRKAGAKARAAHIQFLVDQGLVRLP